MQRGAGSQPRSSPTVVSLKAFELPTCCLSFSLQRSEISTIFICVTQKPSVFILLYFCRLSFQKATVSFSSNSPKSDVSATPREKVRGFNPQRKAISGGTSRPTWGLMLLRTDMKVKLSCQRLQSHCAPEFKDLKVDAAQPSTMVFAAPVWAPAPLLTFELL